MKKTIGYLRENDCFRAARPMQPTGILLHSTGVDQKRISAYTRQWDRAGVEVCVHGFIGLDDDGELCYRQTLPYDIRCWGCGSGKNGSFNASHIQIEICEDSRDDDWCRLTYAAALELCREICATYGISPENVVTHCEAHAMGYASNHADIMHWWPRLGLSMEGFRRELAAAPEAGDEAGDEDYRRFLEHMARYERELGERPCSPYAMDACRRAVESGIYADAGGGLPERPLSPLKRQELAVLLERLGLTEAKE